MITRVIKDYCSRKDQNFIAGQCRGNFTVLEEDSFYPIWFGEVEKLLKKTTEEDMQTALSNSFGLHLWNHRLTDLKSKITSQDQFIYRVFKKHCPQTEKHLMQFNLPSILTVQQS